MISCSTSSNNCLIYDHVSKLPRSPRRPSILLKTIRPQDAALKFNFHQFPLLATNLSTRVTKTCSACQSKFKVLTIKFQSLPVNFFGSALQILEGKQSQQRVRAFLSFAVFRICLNVITGKLFNQNSLYVSYSKNCLLGRKPLCALSNPVLFSLLFLFFSPETPVYNLESNCLI